MIRLNIIDYLRVLATRGSVPLTFGRCISFSLEMADLVALLTFPSVSDGFSPLRSVICASHTTLPSLPLSKVARLDADSDSGSASRSRAGVHPTPRSVVAGGPIRVSISGSLRECPHFCELFQVAEYDDRPRATVYRTSN